MITKRLPIEDLISREARRLAIERLFKTKPLPSNAEFLISAELASNPEHQTRAKTNVLAQKAAHQEALRAIGLDSIEIDPLELDL